MPNELLKLTLYEDDADKGGHNPKNEKNKVAYKEKQEKLQLTQIPQ